jgi:hypothetical protein
VRARVRKRFKDVKEDNDPMLISNELALAEMIISQYKRSTNAADEAEYHRAKAVDIMRKESVAFLGKTKTPAITFTRGFGIGADLPYVR